MNDFIVSRRAFLLAPAALAVLMADGRAAPGGAMPPRSLGFHNLHTGERTEAVFAHGAEPHPPGQATLSQALRDWRSGAVAAIDPRLFDLLHRIRAALGSSAAYDLISGYRDPATNARLAAASNGGVSTRSLHMTGQAVDVALPGVALAALRDAAVAAQGGGVGYYPRDGFVHIDTGRVRRW